MTLFRYLISACCALAPLSLAAQQPEDLLEQGREAFMNYDFQTAAAKYAAAKKKARKPAEDFIEKYDSYQHRLSMAENFLERVEDIAIIDSIAVPREAFFRAYHLPASSGSLGGEEALPFRIKYVDYVFTNEADDYKLWAMPDSTGYYRIAESSLLTDGSWSDPHILSDELAEEGDQIFPFMMADGVTLYYAANDENSIGGYDIMVATRDAADGTFLQPQNLGFPYNSPYDDYLLAFDELNGVGWWVTDRHQLDDQLTLYVFIPNDVRKNRSADEDDILSFARIDDYMATQPEDADYDELLATIRAINPGKRSPKPEFYLPASQGRIYTNYDQLPSALAKASAKRYFEQTRNLDSTEADLRNLRMQFHDAPSQSLRQRIIHLEERLEKLRAAASEAKNTLYQSLKN